ncbi:MAG: ABC transporter [Pontixanthobacter sp.]
MTVRARIKPAALAAVAVVIVAGLAMMLNARDDGVPREPVGLMTSLPIYWNDGDDFGALAAGDSAPHWVRTALENAGDLVPLDTLAAEGSGDPSPQLVRLSRLVLAQPRALAPVEFAALDRWVRAGGHVLIFADPQLTEHADFALGDPRNPQAVALLSPILAHWGLRQTMQERTTRVSHRSESIPVDAGGTFDPLPEASANCAIGADGYLATCRIGSGRAIIWGDAAVLDAGSEIAQNGAAIGMLLNAAFSADGGSGTDGD